MAFWKNRWVSLVDGTKPSKPVLSIFSQPKKDSYWTPMTIESFRVREQTRREKSRVVLTVSC